MAHQEHPTDVACGDPAMTPELREALTLLRDGSDNSEFRALVDEILSGQCSLYDAAGTPAFAEAVFGRVVQQFNERFADMTEEEKQEALAAEGGMHSAAMCADLHRQSLGEGHEAGETGPCGSPCSTCTALCGKAGGHPEH
ncbi:MAG TPA: hypothetical protein VHH34_05905 [Pseudonocardiaceae bacterium]|nr:hypothetical protein [Pseudonocardiaceae bacterium]